MDSAFMYPYQDTVDQGLLDRLQSTNRQLFMILGRQQHDQKKKLLQKEIAANSKLIQYIKKYQTYRKLQQQQKDIQICLQQTVNQFTKYEKLKKQQQKKRKQLEKLRDKYEQMLKNIKTGEQKLHKIHRYCQQIQIIQKAGQQIRPQQIVNYLPGLNSIKTQILEQKHQIHKRKQELAKKIQILKKSIEQEDRNYEKLLKDKFLLVKQMQVLKGNRITRKSEYQKKNEIKPKVDQFRATRRIISHKSIIQKVSIPVCYWLWLVILVIWILGLILWPRAIKPEVCY